MIKRIFDIVCAFLALILLSPVFAVIIALIKLTSRGPVLYWSERVGKDGEIFRMPKFRTMCPTAPKLPTSELESPEDYVTSFGAFLRKSSLDELPQIFSILKGDMSIVGPRPVIRDERKLIRMRKDTGVSGMIPGLTGWAQVNGRDRLTDNEKAHFDKEYLQNQSLLFDLFIIMLTTKRFLWDESVSH